MVTLYNKMSFVNINVLTNMNEQWTIHLLHNLLIFVNVNKNSHSLFMLVHSALMFTNTTCDFNA